MGSPDARFLAELQARRTAVQAMPDHLATDPSGLAQGARLALQCAGLTWATGGDRGDVAGWLTEAARMGGALFRLAWRAEPPLAVPIAHRTTTLSGPVDASVVHVGRWLQLTSCAIAVRDAPSIALFAATPRAVLEGSASTGDRFLYPLAAALAGYCTGDPATADHLVAALELTDERSLRVLPAAQVQDLYVPAMNVLFELLGGDPGRVGSALAQAFARHDDYRSGRHRTSDDLVSPLHLAVAALAADRGVDVGVLAGTSLGPLAAPAPTDPPPLSLCGLCLTPGWDPAPACPACGHARDQDAPVEVAYRAWWGTARVACPGCGARIPGGAVRCAVCLSAVDGPPPRG